MILLTLKFFLKNYLKLKGKNLCNKKLFKFTKLNIPIPCPLIFKRFKSVFLFNLISLTDMRFIVWPLRCLIYDRCFTFFSSLSSPIVSAYTRISYIIIKMKWNSFHFSFLFCLVAKKRATQKIREYSWEIVTIILFLRVVIHLTNEHHCCHRVRSTFIFTFYLIIMMSFGWWYF